MKTTFSFWEMVIGSQIGNVIKEVSGEILVVTVKHNEP